MHFRPELSMHATDELQKKILKVAEGYRAVELLGALVALTTTVLYIIKPDMPSVRSFLSNVPEPPDEFVTAVRSCLDED